jgi:hypothetical protein
MGQNWEIVDSGTVGKEAFCQSGYLKVVNQLETELNNRKTPAEKIAYLRSVTRTNMFEGLREANETPAQTLERLQTLRRTQITESCRH